LFGTSNLQGSAGRGRKYRSRPAKVQSMKID
jgi:hypothetical protein